MEFLFVVAGIAIAIGIGLTKSRNQAVNQAWTGVARRLDLSLREASFGTSPQLSGFVAGHDVTVDIKKKRAGKGQSAWTRFRLGMPPLGLGLKLKRQGFFGGLNKVFGSGDIDIGDAEFDQQVLVVGKSEALMREYLTPERRRTVLNFLNSFTGAVITDDEITFSSRGYERNADDVIQTINAMIVVAESLSEMRDDATPELEPGLNLEPEPERKTEPQPEQKIETQPERKPERRSDLQPQPDPRSIASNEADNSGEVAVSSAAESPGIDEFCNAVFAPGILSFDSTRSFKRDFEGKRVRWSGTLESAAPFTVDFDFGSSSGVRAVLTIDAHEANLIGAREVKAVVGLPVGTNGLDERIGQRVAFTGTLRKVDGFGRKVFVADAALAG